MKKSPAEKSARCIPGMLDGGENKHHYYRVVTPEDESQPFYKGNRMTKK